MVEVEIEDEKCIGCMSCTSRAPNVYELNDDRKAVVIEGVDLEEHLEDVELGADICPTNAIKVIK